VKSVEPDVATVKTPVALLDALLIVAVVALVVGVLSCELMAIDEGAIVMPPQVPVTVNVTESPLPSVIV
jgi:hypothetical protein